MFSISFCLSLILSTLHLHIIIPWPLLSNVHAFCPLFVVLGSPSATRLGRSVPVYIPPKIHTILSRHSQHALDVLHTLISAWPSRLRCTAPRKRFLSP